MLSAEVSAVTYLTAPATSDEKMRSAWGLVFPEVLMAVFGTWISFLARTDTNCTLLLPKN